jgi:glutamine amidotransferase
MRHSGFLTIAPTELWALRYPNTHGLFVLQRQAGGTNGTRHLEHASGAGTAGTHAARSQAGT